MRHRPRFALVLVALVGAAAGLVALVPGGGGQPGGTVRVPTSGHARACVATRAEFAATARQELVAPVQASVPVSVTKRSGNVAVTLSETIVERATASRAVEVRRASVANGRACARASTPDAARSAALTRAYQNALASARTRATAAASAGLRTYAAQQLTALLANARREAEARAQTATATVRASLARRALAQATARARAVAGGR